MKWRWLFFDYVDREISLSRAERRRIHRSSHRHLGRVRIPIGIFLLIATVLAAPIAGLWLLEETAIGRALVYGDLTPIVIVLWYIIGGYVGLAYVMGRFAAPACWRALREHGFDVCARCGYSLRELDDSSTRCPECGAERQPMPEEAA